jgi:ABC-2 type transport system ATP-binding protein
MFDPVRYLDETRGVAVRGSEVASKAVLTRGLVRRFGSVRAVDGIDLSVDRGEIYGFLGPNGAGKSTAVRVLCTLLRPHDGVAFVAGLDVRRQPQAVRLRIGVALQETALDDRQTGRELLVLQGRLYGMTAAQVQDRVSAVLQLVDIGDAIDRRIGGYSGGMKRRLDLAAALIHRPQVLFLDEPTTGLDPLSRASVWAEIRRLNDDLGMTIFLTTQYLDEADALADRVGIIDRGRVVAEGTPEELKRSIGQDRIVAEVSGDDPSVIAKLQMINGVDSVSYDRGRIVVSTKDGPADLSPVAIALGGTAIRVKTLTLCSPSLDDVFMQLTGSHIEEAVPA